MIGPLLQAPADSLASPVAAPWYHAVQDLGWVDVTALSVIAVFFVVGLFKGFVWQISRVAILVVAYVVAGRFGADLGASLAQLMGSPVPSPEQQDTSVYLAYVAIFLGVLIVLSLLALLLQKLVRKAGMTFFDRLGGGVVGIATGGAVVLFLLAVVLMFFHGSNLAEAAGRSKTGELSQQAIGFFGKVVPDEVRRAFGLQALEPAAPAAPGGNALPVPKGN